MNYQTTQHVRVDHGSLHWETWSNTHSKPIKFGFKLWVMEIPLGHCIQFQRFAGTHIIIGNYFASPAFLRHLSAIGVVGKGTMRECTRTSLQYVVKIIKS